MSKSLSGERGVATISSLVSEGEHARSLCEADNSPAADDRQFQLVTWAKDRRLRLWPISDEITRVRNAPPTLLSLPHTHLVFRFRRRLDMCAERPSSCP